MFKTKILLSFLIILILIKAKNNFKDILVYPKFQIDEYKTIFDLLNIKNTLDLFRKKNIIENIFILISIFPFIKNEIVLTKKNHIYTLLKYIFNIKNNEIIKLNKNNITIFSNNFDALLNYHWEDLPNKNKTNYIRHILYNYYPKNALIIYERSLNLNIQYFIDKNRKIMTYELIKDLMSKN